ncbi:MAG: MBL fold metallo-hydrolase [Candidatus Kapabacteria bacterium]|nr:MBL fold metallo-hydrolase [Candidatus Kapabacteria bacterium]
MKKPTTSASPISETRSRRRFLHNAGLVAAALATEAMLPRPVWSAAGSTKDVKPSSTILAAECDSPHPHDIRIRWIGHSTVLLTMGGVNILTDPVLFDRYGINILGVTVGPERLVQPAFTVDTMPKPDLVLLSHAHMDHMDTATLAAIAHKFPHSVDVITASRTADIINDYAWRSLNEMDWGDTASVGSIRLKALRVKHNGWRLPGEACRANGQPRTGRSYNGYCIEQNGIRIVFGGDTAYTRDFADVGPVDVAIMPIGAYDPYPETHCTPEEALAMATMMKARAFVPIHHSTFKQSEEPLSEPLRRLRKAMQDSTTQLALASVGKTVTVRLA